MHHVYENYRVSFYHEDERVCTVLHAATPSRGSVEVFRPELMCEVLSYALEKGHELSFTFRVLMEKA